MDYSFLLAFTGQNELSNSSKFWILRSGDERTNLFAHERVVRRKSKWALTFNVWDSLQSWKNEDLYE